MAYTKEFEEHFLNEDMYKLGEKKGVLKTPSFREKKYREDIPLEMRGIGKEVQVEPEEIKEELTTKPAHPPFLYVPSVRSLSSPTPPAPSAVPTRTET